MIKIGIAKKSDLGEVSELRFLAQKHSALFDKGTVISDKTKKELAKLTKQEFQDSRVIFLLAKEGGCACGLAILSLAPQVDKVAYLGELFVGAKYRSQGLGKQLIREAIKIVKSEGLRNIRVSVARKNLPAQKFYRTLGFYPKEREYLLFEKVL